MVVDERFRVERARRVGRKEEPGALGSPQAGFLSTRWPTLALSDAKTSRVNGKYYK